MAKRRNSQRRKKIIKPFALIVMSRTLDFQARGRWYSPDRQGQLGQEKTDPLAEDPPQFENCGTCVLNSGLNTVLSLQSFLAHTYTVEEKLCNSKIPPGN